MLAFLPACEDDETSLGAIETSTSVLNKLTEQNYVLDEPVGDEDPFQFRLTWSKARFFYESGDIAYVPIFMPIFTLKSLMLWCLD